MITRSHHYTTLLNTAHVAVTPHLAGVCCSLSIVTLRLRGVTELQRPGVDVKTSQFSGERRRNQLVVLHTLNTHTSELQTRNKTLQDLFTVKMLISSNVYIYTRVCLSFYFRNN